MRITSLIVATALSLAGQKLDPDLIRKLERSVADEMSADSIPGLAIAVATNGELRWSAAYGLQDLENFTPAKAVTSFRVAFDLQAAHRRRYGLRRPDGWIWMHQSSVMYPRFPRRKV